MIQNIPLIIPNFNQFSYLRNMVNQFHFYYPENKIIVVDNGSNYEPLLKYYQLPYYSDGNIKKQYDDYESPLLTIVRYAANDFVGNLTHFLEKLDSEYLIISDPDISIHPATPPNFLEIFKAIIDSGVHHVGFDLIYEDIPYWNKKAKWIAGDEKALHDKEYYFPYGDIRYSGFKAPIDTTFAMYKKGGWSAPMKPEHWDNSVRMFKAHHLTWYLHPEHLIEEMTNYFATCRKRTENDVTSAGVNHFRPE